MATSDLRATPRLPNGSEIAVIGAGAVGLCVSYFLARQDRRVCVLDRGALGAATSWGNCGLVTPSHGEPMTRPGSVAMALRSVLDRFSEETSTPDQQQARALLAKLGASRPPKPSS